MGRIAGCCDPKLFHRRTDRHTHRWLKQRLTQGYAVLGPDVEERYFDLKLPLPADLSRGYSSRKGEALAKARGPIDSILLAEPSEQPEVQP